MNRYYENLKIYLRFDALDEVTTAPARAWGGEPSACAAKLLLGVTEAEVSVSELTVTQTGT